MKMPWTGKAGLAKAVAFFATLLLVSIGLCGVNFLSVAMFVPFSGGDSSTLNWRSMLTGLLVATGTLESVGIAVGLLGLLACFVAFIVREMRAIIGNAKDHKENQ